MERSLCMMARRTLAGIQIKGYLNMSVSNLKKSRPLSKSNSYHKVVSAQRKL